MVAGIVAGLYPARKAALLQPWKRYDRNNHVQRMETGVQRAAP